MTRLLIAAIIILGVVLALVLEALVEAKPPNAGLPVVQASVVCVPPTSHYLWKQRRIA